MGIITQKLTKDLFLHKSETFRDFCKTKKGKPVQKKRN